MPKVTLICLLIASSIKNEHNNRHVAEINPATFLGSIGAVDGTYSLRPQHTGRGNLGDAVPEMS